MNPQAYCEAIEAHYARAWHPPANRIRWDRGPIDDLPEDFCVLVIPRTSDIWAFATRCMSQITDAERLELHVLARPGSDPLAIAELLVSVAHYHRTGHALGFGHSVNFGRPWLAGSTCTHGLISLPYLDGPALEWLEDPSVRFLWLIPVTEAEVSFKKEAGIEELEQRFETTQFDYLDPFRASVV